MTVAHVLHIAGRSIRVTSSAPAPLLEELATTIDDRIGAVAGAGGRPSDQQILLATIALAHELHELRAEHSKTKTQARAALSSLLARVDSAIDSAGPT